MRPPTRKEYWLNYRKSLRERAIKRLGGKCARCGFSDHRALQFDHVNGGGKRYFAHRSTYGQLLQFMRGEGPELQLLCANCNWIKRAEEWGARKIHRRLLTYSLTVIPLRHGSTNG